MERYGTVIRLKPGALDEYVRLHEAVWPEVLATISACNIRNYSIYYQNGLLFAYLEAGAKAAMLHGDVTFEIAAIAQSFIFFLVTAQSLYSVARRRRAA